MNSPFAASRTDSSSRATEATFPVNATEPVVARRGEFLLTSPRTRRLSVLCMTDDSQRTAWLARSLRSRGIDVIRAHHGTHGYYQIVTKRPDAVIIDSSSSDSVEAMLTGMLRPEMLLPVLVVNDTLSDEQQRRLKSHGVHCFLPRPASIQDLVDALRSQLEPE
ncbi:MAG: hypothetical protein KDB14_06905 [Planctomycetales bacterium]|nr:hypothetical protein [Planctomycetales bacterium]